MSVSVSLILLLLLTVSSFAQTAKLGQLGCDAPKLEGLDWVKGEPFEMKTGSVYVIEFWATWCGPCIKGIPHLTELQHTYKDKNVTVLGISTETNGKVRPFVTKKTHEMGYTVAIDAKGLMNKAYMKAFAQGGIPHAFIVNKAGKIAWRGHPMTMDNPLKQIVEGTFNIAEFAAKMAEEKKQKELAQLAFKKKGDTEQALNCLTTATQFKIDGRFGEFMEQKRAALQEKLSLSKFHSFTVNDIDSKKVSLSDYQGKVILVVNVASKCGYTKQYAPLQKLYDTYKDRGFVILGFPANNFGRQEPGTDSEIQAFCTSKFDVTFPLFSKISVKGNDIHPLYAYLTSPEENGPFGKPIAWNFNKFLIGKDGTTIDRYPSKTEPFDTDLVSALEKALRDKG